MAWKWSTQRFGSQWCFGKLRRSCSYRTTVPCDGEKKGTFHTSRGWFENLRKQISLYKKTGESASADYVAGPEYAEHFKMIRALNHNKSFILMGQAWNFSTRWRLSWYHAGRCTRTCRSHSNQRASLSCNLVSRPPYTLRHLITVTTSSQECHHHGKCKNNFFLTYVSCVCFS